MAKPVLRRYAVRQARSKAATRIQSLWRGRRARKAYAAKRRTSAIAKRVITRMAEKKETNNSVAKYNISYTYGANLDLQVFAIGVGGGATGFVIPQGTGQAQRVGNKIRVKSARLKMVCGINPYDASLNNNASPCLLRVFIMYDKQNPTDMPQPGTHNDFFQGGNATVPFSGSTQDYTYYVNSDRYRVLYSKTIKLGFSTTYTNTAQALAPEMIGAPNNDYKMTYMLNIPYGKWLPKTVRYNDNGANYDPACRGLYLFCYAVPADGLIPTGSPGTQYPCYIAFSTRLKYTDV